MKKEKHIYSISNWLKFVDDDELDIDETALEKCCFVNNILCESAERAIIFAMKNIVKNIKFFTNYKVKANFVKKEIIISNEKFELIAICDYFKAEELKGGYR